MSRSFVACRSLSLALVVLLLLGACATSTGGFSSTDPGTAAAEDQHPLKQWLSKQSRAKKKGIFGALLGAAAGAASAALTGRDPWEGAAVGALAGGVAGFLLGKRKDAIFASRDAAVEKLAYDPSQGYVIQVEEVSFEPSDPGPGETVEMYVRYLVVGPNPKEEIQIHSFMGLKYDDAYVLGNGPAEFAVPHGGGIVESKFKLTLPEEAPTGSYAVEALVEDAAGRSQGERSRPMYLS